MDHKKTRAESELERLKANNQKLQNEIDKINSDSTRKHYEEIEDRARHLNQLCAEQQDMLTQQETKLRGLETMKDRAEYLAEHVAQLEQLAEERLVQLTDSQGCEKELEETLDIYTVMGNNYHLIVLIYYETQIDHRGN